MRLRILGPVEVEVGGQPVQLGTLRQRQLLGLLAVRPGQAVAVNRLVEELWEGDPPRSARHSVQVYVHRLRKALGEAADRLETVTSGYRLAVSVRELDSLRFEELLEQAPRAVGDDPELAADRLAAALQLWRGPALSDLGDLSALEPERTRLEALRLGAVEDRIDADLAVGRHRTLLGELRRLVSEHPFRERLWGQLMLAQYRSGQQADALATFRRARRQLDEELGIDPGPRLTELQGRILLQDPTLDGPPPEQPARPPQNLPVSRTSFVGRERDLAELLGLVRTRRLTTVTGPPGAGKTRLAVEAARQAAREFPHGTFYVSLADTDDPELVPSMIASTLRVPASEDPLLETLAAHLRQRRLLLVLDNFEHVVPAAQTVGWLLDEAPQLTVLATSRTPLRLSGEQQYPVGALPVPSNEAVKADPGSDDAVVLFAERARMIDPDFRLSSDDTAVVAEIVARLDRLPLAIELAVPRLRVFPLGELQTQLEPLLTQLADGATDQPERHRTLSDAIGWSYDLLDTDEQALFRRLAVFRGSFTLDAAEPVAGQPPVQDVTQALSNLIEASLVERIVEMGPARFSMLETIREYALRQLHQAGERDEAARRHATFYAQMAQQAESELTGPDHVRWLRRLTSEQPNLRAALNWTQGYDRDPAMGPIMAGSLWRFWQLRGSLTEGRRWLQDILEANDVAAPAARAKALIGLGWVCYWLADLDNATAAYGRALELLQDTDVPQLQAQGLFGQVITLACHRDHLDEAIPFEQQLQDLVAEHPHPQLVVLGLVAAGTIRRFSGDLGGARSYATQVLTMTRQAGNRWWEAEALRALGQIAYEQGDHQEAERALRESLDVASQLGHTTGIAIDLNWLARVLVSQRRPTQGVVLAGAASRIRDAIGGAFTVRDYPTGLEEPEDAAQRMLPEHDIEASLAQGRAMNVQDVLTYLQITTDPHEHEPAST